MTNECVNIDRIAEVLDLSPDDPVRRHVERCPRCSSLLASYRAFIQAEAPAGADLARAEARLMDFLHERIGDVEPAPPSAEKTPGDEGFFARLKGAFVLRPAWVAAALVVVAAAVLWWRPWVGEPPALRSTADSSQLEMQPPESLSGGAVRLSWQAAEGADQYRIVVYDQNLEVLARLDAGSATTYDLSRAVLPAGTPHAVICRIAALQDGDEIAGSAPIRIELP
jgi:hypothetical protein